MKKFSQTYRIKLLILWLTFLAQASITLYLPSLSSIAKSLQISSVQAIHSISIFILSYGLSCIFYGPLSDRYGRKLIVLLGLFLAGLGYFITIFSKTFEVFMLARFLQGLGCGALLIASRAITRDAFSGHELANASSYLSMGFAIGLGVAPLMGGYFLSHFGWHSNFVFLFGFDMLMLILVWYFLPETVTEKDNQLSYQKFFFKKIKNYQTIISNLQILRFSLAGFCAFGVVMAYNIMSPFLMEQTFHLSAQAYGYLALVIGVPYYVAASLNKSIVLKWGVWPSFRMGYILIVGSGLSIVVLNYFFPASLFALIIPVAFACFGQALIFSNTVASALHLFPVQLAGTVAATLSGLLMILTSVLSGLLALLPHTSSLYMALVITGLGLLAALLLRRRTTS